MSDYNFLQRLLHHIALSNPNILEATLDAELSFCKTKLPKSTTAEHVFVSGLARAGTTILMRSLYETGQFCSLTYADMPFVLAPNIWNKISSISQKQIQAKERSHGDGILIDYNSPEALDEVFWRTFCSENYISKQTVTPHSSEPEVLEKFQKYVAAILFRYGSGRYLSKNNNNILRLSSICQAFPNAKILIPFRDPIQHAFSLLTQHQKFNKQQTQDNFVRKYMVWLGHYEFGLSHKAFTTKNAPTNHTDQESIDYWIQQWYNVYSFLLQDTPLNPKNIKFISYEHLCSETQTVWKTLGDYLKIDNVQTPEMSIRHRETPTPADSSQLKKAQQLYEKLSQLSEASWLIDTEQI